MRFIDLMVMGRKVNNVTTGASNFSVSTTSHLVTCPIGRRWLFLGGHVMRDNSSTLEIGLKDAADKLIWHFATEGAATSNVNFPNIGGTVTFSRGMPSYPLIIDEEEYIEFAWGTAQGSSAQVSCMVLEWMYEP